MHSQHLLAATVLFMPLIANAEDLALGIGGSYGSKDGCAYAKTGESSGADSFLLLTPTSVTTAVSSCEFKKILKTSAKSFTVSASCQAEGEESGTDEVMDITRIDNSSYRILFKDGTNWGPLKKCR